MAIEIRQQSFDPWDCLREYEARHRGALAGASGATAVFVGSMRDFNEGDTVTAMHLEHYPGMTERHLQAISDEAAQRWDILDSLIVHRVGDIHPSESIVLVAVWSSHRAAAFDASRYLMEELKSRAPFWKKEQLHDGEARWVEQNTPDPGARDLLKGRK